MIVESLSICAQELCFQKHQVFTKWTILYHQEHSLAQQNLYSHKICLILFIKREKGLKCLQWNTLILASNLFLSSLGQGFLNYLANNLMAGEVANCFCLLVCLFDNGRMYRCSELIMLLTSQPLRNYDTNQKNFWGGKTNKYSDPML